MSAKRAKKSKVAKPRIGKPPKLQVVGFEDKKGRRQRPGDFGIAEAAYFAELHGVVDRVFSYAAKEFEWTWAHLAIESGLAYQTVAHLGERKTKWPQFRTVWRLCKAVGWDLVEKRRPKDRRPVVLKVA